jgi:hypothetical protein
LETDTVYIARGSEELTLKALNAHKKKRLSAVERLEEAKVRESMVEHSVDGTVLSRVLPPLPPLHTIHVACIKASTK